MHCFGYVVCVDVVCVVFDADVCVVIDVAYFVVVYVLVHVAYVLVDLVVIFDDDVAVVSLC